MIGRRNVKWLSYKGPLLQQVKKHKTHSPIFLIKEHGFLYLIILFLIVDFVLLDNVLVLKDGKKRERKS